MWHRFSQEMQTAVYRAERAARAQGCRNLATRHLLLAVADSGAGLSSRVLHRLKAAPLDPAEQEKLNLLPEADPEEKLPGLTPAARLAVERSYREAADWEEQTIRPEHLLFGLLRTPESAACRWLDCQGVTVQTAAEALFALEPHRYMVPVGASLPNRLALKIAAARARAINTARLLQRAALALPQIPREPILTGFIARPIRIRYPHLTFRMLRNRGLYQSQLAGGWIASSYELVSQALKEPALSAERYDWERLAGYTLPPRLEREFNRLCGTLSRQMLFRDAPEQTRLRSLVSRQFTPRVLEGMRRAIQEVADSLLDAVEGQGRMDVIADFAFPLPATVIARLLGVESGDLIHFKQWSDDFVRFIGGRATLREELSAYQSLKLLETYFGEVIKKARSAPTNDTLISLFVHAQNSDGARLTDEEIITNSMLLLAAGHETTTHLIGNGLLLLLRHPEARLRLQTDPSLMPSAIEEMLRYEPPVQWSSRVARRDFELGGVCIREGEWINTCLAAANRDPARFPDPDRFDIARTDNKHLSFGAGPHFCLGAALARMEGAIALQTLLRRFPRLRMADRQPHWRVDFTFRAQTRLPVILRSS